MTRWSKEEDEFILEYIKSIKDDIEYDEMIKIHNVQYKVDRTEIAYKTRVKKIAKENNIELSNSKKWKEEELNYIINEIQCNPFDIDWETMTNQIHRTKDSIHRKYNEIVSAEEHLDCCLINIDKEDIMNLIKDLSHICIRCSMIFYSAPYIWRENEYCEDCHKSEFQEDITYRWEYIREYSAKQGKDCCNICKKKLIIDKDNIRRCHYDHIDMFDKSNSVCTMIYTGIDLVEIIDEIDKCQLLCISCHNIITRIEHECGFIRVKRSIMKEYKDTNEDSKKNELINTYSIIYNTFMESTYNYIKKIVNE
jgi:hypothetical protein